ncbi:MAG: hypothetical protein JWN01_91 [Patescibacteria group bacterium]|nr:hypothetical protein [Patescibacteria group bacterium]
MQLTLSSKFITAAFHYLSRRPHIAVAIGLIAFLAVFQTHFLFSGDVWAEGYAEYLVNALTVGWGGFFALGWADYFNLIPKLLCDLYVSFHLPVGYIDYYYRAVVVAYTVGSLAFIAHPFNRAVIKNDYLRALLALATLETLYHVSSFSFINVWYVGFVPVILISLNTAKLPHSKRLIYTVFAAAVSLTKPSITLLPLVVYRTIKTKEYLSGSIISGAIMIQTIIMLLAYKSGSFDHVKLTTKAAVMALGSGLMVLKTLHIPPVGFWMVVLATLLLAALGYYIAKTKGLIFAAVLALPLALSIYTYFFVPDLPTPVLFQQFQAIYQDDFKLQRSIMVAFLILLTFYMAADQIIAKKHRLKIPKPRITLGILTLLAGLIAVEYRPIDLQRTAFRADISQFRANLNAGQSVCMPIAPNPGWENYLNVPPGDWFYQSYGGCMAINYEKHLGASNLYQDIKPGWRFAVESSSAKQLKSVLVAVVNPAPEQTRRLELRDTANGKVFPATIRAKTNHEPLSYVAFNLYGETVQDQYNFVLSEKGSASGRVKVGLFKDGTTAYYGLFMGYPNLAEHRKSP